MLTQVRTLVYLYILLYAVLIVRGAEVPLPLREGVTRGPHAVHLVFKARSICILTAVLFMCIIYTSI